jgi:hypothetical protein
MQVIKSMKILIQRYSIPCFPSNQGSILGLLKVGAKHLYVHDSHGQVHERTPLCVLDFYVHESKQRSGYGKRLFDVMLEVNLFKEFST